MKRHTWSWLRLLILFVMSTLTLSLVLGAVLVGVTVVVAGDEPPQVTADWPGHLRTDISRESAPMRNVLDAHAGKPLLVSSKPLRKAE